MIGLLNHEVNMPSNSYTIGGESGEHRRPNSSEEIIARHKDQGTCPIEDLTQHHHNAAKSEIAAVDLAKVDRVYRPGMSPLTCVTHYRISSEQFMVGCSTRMMCRIYKSRKVKCPKVQ